MALAGVPLGLAIYLLASPDAYLGWRIVAAIACLPAAVIWLYFVRRFWRAWKEYQTENQERLKEQWSERRPREEKD